MSGTGTNHQRTVEVATAAQTRITGKVWCQWHNGFSLATEGSKVKRGIRKQFKCFLCQSRER